MWEGRQSISRAASVCQRGLHDMFRVFRRHGLWGVPRLFFARRRCDGGVSCVL